MGVKAHRKTNSRNSKMQIFIKTLTGRKTSFNFELDNTVRHVKEALQEKEGIQVEQIRLIYSGKQMSDECNLSDYNVKPGSTVHMVLSSVAEGTSVGHMDVLKILAVL